MSGEKNLEYGGEADLQYYKDVATSIDYPPSDQETPETVTGAAEPRRLRNRSKDEIREMTLQEALHTALLNSDIIRTSGEFLSPANNLMARPDFAPSIYDPAIQESGFLFGQRGVEAALADFDATLTSSMRWGRNEQISEQPNINFAAGDSVVEETGRFRSELAKVFSYGGRFSVEHNWDYSGRNQQFNGNGRLFPSHFTSLAPDFPTVGAEYRHPLLAGSGAEFNRIAGPIGNNLFGVSGVAQGVVIARINNDITLADFEASVRNMIKDVQDAYWDLYLAYRNYDSEVVARNSSLRTWREVKVKADTGIGTGVADVAQARDNYFEIRARSESALSNVYSSESRLRRLLAMPVNDGMIIRPADEPVTAEFNPDWRMCLVDALSRRVELRKQKWNIKSLSLQVKAAQSLTRPRLDFIGSYYANGFGDRLLGHQNYEGDADSALRQRFDAGYDTLVRGDHTGWTLGAEFSMPLGFRAAHAQKRNLELRLAKARAGLAAQELEVSHELAAAFQNLDRAFVTAQTNFNRRRAAELRVQAFQAEFNSGRLKNVDLLLRAQISLAQAEVAYYSSLVDYNKSINELQYRKGTLLEDTGVQLAEALWEPGAYKEALRRAWARSHAFDSDHLHDEPAPFTNCEYCDGHGCELCDEAVEEASPTEPAPAPAAPAKPELSPSPSDKSAELDFGFDQPERIAAESFEAPIERPVDNFVPPAPSKQDFQPPVKDELKLEEAASEQSSIEKTSFQALEPPRRPTNARPVRIAPNTDLKPSGFRRTGFFRGRDGSPYADEE